MDLLILMRVAAALQSSLGGSSLEALAEESPHRYRLTFAGRDGRPRHVEVSLRPELPWIGRRALPASRSRPRGSAFVATVGRRLEGGIVAGVRALDPGRVLEIAFHDGHRLVVELATHGANLVALDGAGSNLAAAHHPKGSAERLKPGEPWRPPPLPPGRVVPFGMDPDSLDRVLLAAQMEGESRFEAIRRRLFGVGTAAARLVEDEVAATGASAGAVLARRLGEVASGAVDPVIEAAEDPRLAIGSGTFDPESSRLLPWPPLVIPAARRVFSGRDAAETAGLYHEAVERTIALADRAKALRAILAREARRAHSAALKADSDVRAFHDPERHRLGAEALLAGLHAARRNGDAVLVPDPYDPDGAPLEVPAAPGRPLTAVADDLFRAYRRARRGIESASRRGDAMRSRAGRLERLGEVHERARTEAEIEAFAADLRSEGIAVGLEAPTRRGRDEARGRPIRLEGVRLVRSPGGSEILVGRTGRDNDRLTFKLAGPDDFWFHALGAPGAHVVVRNPNRDARPPADAIAVAAAAAAWFSGAREHVAAEVQWTRRKNVRRARGAAPGTVVVKRYETVRVRPVAPEIGEDLP